MAPRSRRTCLTLQRKFWILECRRIWMNMQNSDGDRKISLMSNEWTNYLFTYLNGKDKHVQIFDVQRWLQNHPWIVDPDGEPKPSSSKGSAKKHATKRSREEYNGQRNCLVLQQLLSFGPSNPPSGNTSSNGQVAGGDKEKFHSLSIVNEPVVQYFSTSSFIADSTTRQSNISFKTSPAPLAFGGPMLSPINPTNSTGDTCNQLHQQAYGGGGEAVLHHNQMAPKLSSGQDAASSQPEPLRSSEYNDRFKITINKIKDYGYIRKNPWKMEGCGEFESDLSTLTPHVQSILMGMKDLIQHYGEGLKINIGPLVGDIVNLETRFRRSVKNVLTPIDHKGSMKDMANKIAGIPTATMKSEPMDTNERSFDSVKSQIDSD